MADLRMRTASTVNRILVAAILLAVFFLPLHFHFSSSAQLTSQCSCVHGARSPLVVPDSAPAILPTNPFITLLAAQSEEWNFTAPQHPFVRGPPLSIAA